MASIFLTSNGFLPIQLKLNSYPYKIRAVILGISINVVHHFSPELYRMKWSNFKSWGLTDRTIFPHYVREDIYRDNSGKSMENRLKEFERDTNSTITRLKDDQYILFHI